ncbi:MAG: hypothetical protein IIZ07_08145 [Ruminococcus sp.]|nr:hypothetical protein [Ruminococcus sp.]
MMENMENTEKMQKICDRIKIYLDNMFASIPDTEPARRMKEDMYCSMLDKYNGLINDGAGEDEAFGRIVGDFGSVEDIRAALAGDSAPSAEAQPLHVQNPTASSVSPERKKQYDRFKIKQGIAIACGVIFCIAAVFGYPFYSCSESSKNFLFGLLIALGVMLFVAAGTGEAKFYDITLPESLKTGVSEQRMAEYRKFLGVRQWLISLAVALFVVSPFVYELHFGLIIMPVLVALGVAVLIILGSVHGTYRDVRVDK